MSDDQNQPQTQDLLPPPPEPVEPLKYYPPTIPVSSGTGTQRGLVIACSIVMLLFTLAVVIGMFALGRFLDKPEAKLVIRQAALMEVCKQQLAEIDGAFERYQIAHNGKYPKKLDELAPYLKNRKVLICPEDVSGKPESSYLYRSPDAEPDSDWLAACPRHAKAGIRFRLVLDRNHRVSEAVMP